MDEASFGLRLAIMQKAAYGLHNEIQAVFISYRRLLLRDQKSEKLRRECRL